MSYNHIILQNPDEWMFKEENACQPRKSEGTGVRK
jgi:hypothetical protein